MHLDWCLFIWGLHIVFNKDYYENPKQIANSKIVLCSSEDSESPHPEERPQGRVSKDGHRLRLTSSGLPRIDDASLEQDGSGGVVDQVEQERTVDPERHRRRSRHRRGSDADGGCGGGFGVLLGDLDDGTMHDLVNMQASHGGRLARHA